MKLHWFYIPYCSLQKTIALLAAVILTAGSLSAQDTAAANDSMPKPVVIFAYKDSANTKPIAKYVYRQPTNELMRWPNYPLTAEQVQRNMDNNAEKRKILPSVVNQLLSSKKKMTGTTPPKF